ncbi:hypothetical protein SAMN05444008_11740 [Cnuella takakiae]|uniref:Uncharacterized protein n=1 Tax=Cnuella takakiae TaxID=1302690 RepID=A0A1M5GSS7_9BACT|nr:hypothetical protein [Cnuella takakiae]OLY90905.1 hypothetical protein BUE76_02585 [Cnuella takakiae]SHG06667.1 hypothetical protein SAMN05444008_11740 [Cnuella takakiae]
MRTKFFLSGIIAMLLTAPCMAQSSTSVAAAKDSTSATQQLVQSLLDTWVIDLRPSPDAEPYLKDFVLKAFDAQTLKGSFYDTPFANGRIHTAWGKLYFAFTTADGSGTYFHSGYLENGKLSGLSFSPSREFVMPWTGVRKQ